MANIQTTGSEKQVSWAQDIIANALPAIDAHFAGFLARITEEYGDADLAQEIVNGQSGTVAAFVSSKTDAAWWITQYEKCSGEGMILDRELIYTDLARRIDKLAHGVK